MAEVSIFADTDHQDGVQAIIQETDEQKKIKFSEFFVDKLRGSFTVSLVRKSPESDNLSQQKNALAVSCTPRPNDTLGSITSLRYIYLSCEAKLIDLLILG